jgi:hypothetical protein
MTVATAFELASATARTGPAHFSEDCIKMDSSCESMGLESTEYCSLKPYQPSIPCNPFPKFCPTRSRRAQKQQVWGLLNDMLDDSDHDKFVYDLLSFITSSDA